MTDEQRIKILEDKVAELEKAVTLQGALIGLQTRLLDNARSILETYCEAVDKQ